MSSTPSPDPEPIAALIGWDWGRSAHALALQPADATAVELADLPHSAEALHAWLDALEQRFQGRTVAVALEGAKGPIFTLLSERPWIRIHCVHPATTARFRSAFTPSGAKDDRPDALLLLDLLRHHRHKIPCLHSPGAASQRLDLLCRLRRDIVDRRTQLTNELNALLQKYFPQALEFTGEHLYTPMALAFLQRWPSLTHLKASRPSSLRSFFFRHNVRSPACVQQRLERLAQCRPLTRDQDLIDTCILELNLLCHQLAGIQRHLDRVEKPIQQAFAAHPDAALFRDLPGAGKALAPRLAAAFGEDRDRFPDPSSLQKRVGVAPVLERSGASRKVRWRLHASVFLRQTFVEWARCSVASSSWAAAYFRLQKAQGKKAWVIYRALAFKWIRILWKCWQTRCPYNEAIYLDQLRKRQSPLLKELQISTP